MNEPIIIIIGLTQCNVIILNCNFPSLFYAGACEGQMPEILTMIQINRLTPAPAVLTIVSCVE
jgi:hypothetical protein